MTRPLPHAAGLLHKVEDKKAGFVGQVQGAVAADPSWSFAYEQMLKESICLFAADVLNIELGPHLMIWEKMVQSQSRIAINAARDHSKSTFFSYVYPIWRAFTEPGCEVYIFSKTLEQSMEFLDIIIYGRNNLKGMLNTPVLAGIVPEEGNKGGSNGRTRLKRTDVRFKNGSRIRAIGYGKAIRGAHPKYIVLDDPLNDEDMYSETVRNKNIEYFKSAIVNMLHPQGQICCVGTPYHISDLWGFLRENPKYLFKKFPGIIKDKKGNERALFPWRWTLKALRDKKEEIGTVSFAREILCEPITDDLAIFPSYLFPPLYDKTLKLRPTRDSIRERGLSVFMGVDIARSASVAADFFVIFVIGIDNNGNHYIIDIVREKGLPFIRQQEMIKHTARRYGVDLVLIESNNMQQVWSDEVIRTTDLPVKPFETTAQNKYPLDKGVPGLRILLENAKVIIPRGDEYSVKQTNAWMTEAQQFGFIDGKLQGIGEHDDTVMAWWFSEEAAKLGGFSFGFGDEDDDGLEEEMTGGTGGWEDELLGTDDEFEEGELAL
jgi:hypothetical protein